MFVVIIIGFILGANCYYPVQHEGLEMYPNIVYESQFQSSIDKIMANQPDVIINTLNGDSNRDFFRQLYEAGIMLVTA